MVLEKYEARNEVLYGLVWVILDHEGSREVGNSIVRTPQQR
jgi:hypothetical protein